MNEPIPTRSPAAFAPARGRQHRSNPDSSSPTRQRNTDELLSNLTPRTVVDAFRNPSGTLKACIEAASPSEQAFALRAAVASNSIHDWLQELSAWPWPAGGGSAGFEVPTVKRRLFDTSRNDNDVPSRRPDAQTYTGSLPTSDVALYERRIDEIAHGLEELDIEEIKKQVLNNHIMPLSRPGTPILTSSNRAVATTLMSSSSSSFSSLADVARLDDLTALITATTVQALPNLSKLTRLMDAWGFRLVVLRKIPVFLASLADAEVALRSGWNAISLGTGPAHAGAASVGQNSGVPYTGTGAATLSREEFDVMKSVLGRKVAKAGRDLDAMLDMLEGQPDTLPEEWIDRMDVLENGYGEWTVASERKIKEGDLARLAPRVVSVEDAQQSATIRGGDAVPAITASTSLLPKGQEPSLEKAPPSFDASHARQLDRQVSNPPPVIRIHPTVDEQEESVPEDGYPDTEDDEIAQGTADTQPNGAEDRVLPVPELSEAAHKTEDGESPTSVQAALSGPGPEEISRRGSNASEASTVVHDAPSTFTDSFSSDQFDQGTPERPRQSVADAGGDVSGFPSFRSSTRSMSVSFNDQPVVNELPSFESPPSTPTKSVILEDDVTTEPDSPSEMSEMSMPGTDDQLQQQISEILESVPAKIRLTAEPPPINLNPPDFKMPTIRRKSSRPDAIPRSQSNMSMRSAYSRSGTPSFTLAPAYGRGASARPRHQRGNQEIKLYHLSRSNGEAPIKLFIRCVGEHGERVMVRVGGGWADLGEYLKEYASHHVRRAAAGGVADGTIEVKDVPRTGPVRADTSPPSRPHSALGSSAHDSPNGSNTSPLKMRKTRRPSQRPSSANGNTHHHHLHHHRQDNDIPPLPPLPPTTPSTTTTTTGPSTSSTTRPKTPLAPTATRQNRTPSSDGSSRSRSSGSGSWDEEEGAAQPLGMAGPRAKQIAMSEEGRAWVESVKEKVRIASGERKFSASGPFVGASSPLVVGAGAGEKGEAGESGGLEASLMERGRVSSNPHHHHPAEGSGKGGKGGHGGAVFAEMGKVGSTKRLFIKRG